MPVCPAFPGAGRTVYQGHLFVHDKLLSESGLENHPLNPMTDPDIRRWLQRQTSERVGLRSLPGGVAGRGGAAGGARRGRRGRLHLRGGRRRAGCRSRGDRPGRAGRAASRRRLGIALGLPDNLAEPGSRAGPGAFRPAPGPEAILAGSCSRATLDQIARHREKHPTLAISADAVVAGDTAPEEVVAFMKDHRGAAPLAFTSRPPDEVAALQARHGREALASRLDAFFADVARDLVAGGVTRLVVAGGETSGAVVSALGLTALAVGPEIDPGVPVLSAVGGAPLTLALKSGNFGSPGFFAKALASWRADERGGGAARGDGALVQVPVRPRADLRLVREHLGRAARRPPRDPDQFLPRLSRPPRIAKLDRDGRHVSGDPPSKELFLHRAFYASRPGTGAVVHLHSTYATAWSCLEDLDPADCLPPLTPYAAMRFGPVATVAYSRPGDPAMGERIAALGGVHSAVLLANHGPVVAGRDLRAPSSRPRSWRRPPSLPSCSTAAARAALMRRRLSDLARTFAAMR